MAPRLLAHEERREVRIELERDAYSNGHPEIN
jgi:hypothetical protein